MENTPQKERGEVLYDQKNIRVQMDVSFRQGGGFLKKVQIILMDMILMIFHIVLFVEA